MSPLYRPFIVPRDWPLMRTTWQAGRPVNTSARRHYSGLPVNRQSDYGRVDSYVPNLLKVLPCRVRGLF